MSEQDLGKEVLAYATPSKTEDGFVSLLTPSQVAIREIDQKIDAVVAELLRLTGTKPRTASGYQKAWDKHPALRREYNDLYCRRGAAQLVRDAEEWKAAQSAARRERHVARKAKPQHCPTCGQHVYAAVAT